MNVRHVVRYHPRLLIAITVGCLIGFLLPPSWTLITRALTAWNVTVWSYLILMTWLMTHAGHARVRTLAIQEDESAVAILVILSIAAMISFAAIVLELSMVKDLPLSDRLVHYAFTAATIFGSWFLVGTLFTVHYARMFYRSAADARALAFPNKEEDLDYWDFLYFSFTIAVAAQTSDVSITTRAMRKAVLAQSILSFLFNVAILGLTINIAAGLLG